ncbi:MAG: hypothetical protein J5777_03625 [Clostridiales bacterium]|nr:hypothetical protein [Clostridiales bacterium]
MDRNKTSVVVIFILAGFFFIAIAMVFNTSARRNAALARKDAVEEKIKSLDPYDITIYWIGDVPEELEPLKAKMKVLKPEEVNGDNMPIKFTTFRISVKEKKSPDDKTADEKVTEPRQYSDYMLIVINTAEGFNDSSKEILRNCIVDNGVPVLCIGGKACDMVGTILIHGAGYSSYYSMFYKLHEGYDEPFLNAKAVASGGIDLSEELMDKLCTYFNSAAMQNYVEASERWSSAISSVDEAATATTTPSESTENSTTETTRKIHVKP